MKKCPKCREENRESAMLCVSCGSELTSLDRDNYAKAKKTRKRGRIGNAFISVIIIVMTVVCLSALVIFVGFILLPTSGTQLNEILIDNLLVQITDTPQLAQIQRVMAACTDEDIKNDYGLILWQSVGDLMEYGRNPFENSDKWSGWVPCKGSPVILVRAQTISGEHTLLLVKYGEMSGWVYLDAVLPTKAEYIPPTPMP